MQVKHISKAEKIRRLVNALCNFYRSMKEYLENSPEWMQDLKPFIKRYQLKEVISGTLNITDRHTISGWINRLLANGIISRNPTSSKSAKKRIYMPTDETRYKINPPHTLKVAIPSKGNNGKSYPNH